MADLKYHWAIPVSDPSKHRNAWKAYVGRHYVQACGRAYRGSTYAESAAVYVSYVTKDPEWHCYDCARAARLVLAKESAPKPDTRTDSDRYAELRALVEAWQSHQAGSSTALAEWNHR